MDYRTILEASTGRQKADLVLKNAWILDVYNACFFKGDLAVHGGVIAGIGDYEGEEERDLTGQYLVPGFIDGHLHIESSMVTPAEYARGVVPHGVTTVIADPHEIANVLGRSGVEWIMAAARGLPLTIRWMIPSCVPSAPIEHSGYALTVEDMAALKTQPQTLGMGEMMDFPGLLRGSPDIAAKLALFFDLPRDGHGPGLRGKDLNAYIAAGIRTEHECSTREELAERIRLGMYVQIREGTAASNARTLLPAVTQDNWRRCFFCTDDKDPQELLAQGTIAHILRLALAAGIPPARAYTMASFNAAQAYELKDLGALSPGKRADFLVLTDLSEVKIAQVYVKGQLVHEAGKAPQRFAPAVPPPPLSVRIQPLQEEDLKLQGETFHALVMQPGSLLTTLRSGRITGKDFPYDQGMLKLVNVERHRGLPLRGVCALAGFDLKGGAMATTIAHDAHNLLCAGDNDGDILLAIRHLAALGGGIVLTAQGKVIGELRLPIAGLMSDGSIEAVAQGLSALTQAAHGMLEIPEGIDPFIALSFLALPVIPEVKLTVEGLFSVTEQRLLPSVE